MGFATDGAAEEMLMEEDYDLLSIDVRTPVMNGKQLYEYIKDRCPKLINRVVFTTGDVISGETNFHRARQLATSAKAVYSG